MALFAAFITGNLTADAERKVIQTSKGDRHLISFTVATNTVKEGKPIYTNMEYWISENFGAIEDRMKKGSKVTVQCNNRKDSKYADKNNPEITRTSTTYIVEKVEVA